MRLPAGFAIPLVAALAACGADAPVSRELGARCDDKSECDERCLSGDAFPGGLCSLSCEGPGGCPDGAVCADLEGGVCLFACRSAGACEFLGDGWSCAAVEVRGAEMEGMACLAVD